MKSIVYLTTNEFKVREAKLVLQDKYGFDIEIVNPDFEIFEIQAKTCGEVAEEALKLDEILHKVPSFALDVL